MLTALYSVGSVAGADLWMKVVLLTSLAYFLICFSFRRSRSGRGVLTVLMGWLQPQCLAAFGVETDVWDQTGAYRNGGLGSAVALLLWPVLLCLAGGIVLWICRTGR